MISFGNVIRQKREFLGLSVEDVADILEMDASEYIAVENDQKSLDKNHLDVLKKMLYLSKKDFEEPSVTFDPNCVAPEDVEVTKQILKFVEALDE